MYQPAEGDRVTVTFTTPQGRTYHHTGRLTQVSQHGCGFSLLRDDGGHSWYSDAATLMRLYGVVQTIKPAADPA